MKQKNQEKRIDYATNAHEELAHQVREQHPLHVQHETPQDMEVTSDLRADDDTAMQED